MKRNMTRIIWYTLLLLATVIIKISTAASASSPSGSGDYGSILSDREPTIQSATDEPRKLCHVPSYADFTRIQKNSTAEERERLVIEGRCFLTCTDSNQFEVGEVGCIII